MFKDLRCWWKGHYGKYEQHHTEEHGTVKYYKCRHCGTCVNSSWDLDEHSFWERHEILHFIAVAIAVLLLFFLVSGIIVAIGSLIAHPFYVHTCKQAGTAMGIPWKYDFWSGCFYEIKGQWVADDLLGIVELLK
jgi:hypothetical protein